ncbi:MAG: hypothetical protein R3A52_27300 [Polyangiales bacterium]
MSSRSLRTTLVVALALAPLSCASSRSRTANLAGQSLHGPVRTFTDSDIVHDVAATEGAVWVATDRGVLRYPAAGGAPTRLGTLEGLPAQRVLAVAASEDGASVWAATADGVARKQGDGNFERVGPAQPDVGRPSCLLVLGDDVLLGGATGLARFDGTRWSKLTDQHQITSLARTPDRRVVAGTANRGLLLLSADYASAEEHNVAAGLPEQWVRDVVPLANGDLWALVQGPLGAQLAFYQSSSRRWFSYTTGDVGRGAWLALVPTPNGAGLVTPVGYFEIASTAAKTSTPTNAAPPAAPERLHAHARGTSPRRPLPEPEPRPRLPVADVAAPAPPRAPRRPVPRRPRALLRRPRAPRPRDAWVTPASATDAGVTGDAAGGDDG